MEAKHLRIGNLIMDSPVNGDEIKKVKSLSSNLVFCDDGSHIYNDEMRGIPLTEEWLVKLGFEKKSGSEFEKGRFIYRSQQRDLIIGGFEYDYNGIIYHPEYVHQLQNLYFALTGEELSLIKYKQ